MTLQLGDNRRVFGPEGIEAEDVPKNPALHYSIPPGRGADLRGFAAAGPAPRLPASVPPIPC